MREDESPMTPDPPENHAPADPRGAIEPIEPADSRGAVEPIEPADPRAAVEPFAS